MDGDEVKTAKEESKNIRKIRKSRKSLPATVEKKTIDTKEDKKKLISSIFNIREPDTSNISIGKITLSKEY